MSNINLYTNSNKIRTILLIAIDKEILDSSKKNHILINSQNQEQLTKKFENYRDFTIESEELFENVQNSEDKNIFCDFRCNYCYNILTNSCHSSKKSNESLLHQNFLSESFIPKKNNAKSCFKKSKNSEISKNNSCKFNTNSGKKLKIKKKATFSCKELINFKNTASLKNNNKKYIKQISDDFCIYSVDNKDDDSSKLINYCYKLKKPNNEINNETSTSRNK